MRWMVWNVMGCLLWVAGLLSAKGVTIIEGLFAAEGPQMMLGLGCGVTGLALLMWANILDMN